MLRMIFFFENDFFFFPQGYFAADANFSFKVPEPVKKKKKTDEKSDVKKETPAVKQEKQND